MTNQKLTDVTPVSSLDPTDLLYVVTDVAGTPDSSSIAVSNALRTFARTADEVLAGVTPTDYSYEPGDVRRYGAVCDGVTNDTAAVQSALDSNELDITFPAGKTLLVTTELTASTADRVIHGNGATITTDGTIADADYLMVSSGARTAIKNLNFDGIVTTTDCGGIFISGVKTEVSSCKFTDFDNGGGIIVNSAATGSIIVNNDLDNCSPIQLGGTQYGSIHCNADRCLISGNRITDNDLTGISSNGADYLTISNNYIEGKTTGTTSGGILLDGNNVGCVIDTNTVNGCKVEGIQIAGNIATYTTGSMDHVVSNNILLDCGYSGISMNGDQAGACINITVTGNHIKNDITTARAFELIRLSNSTIAANYVYGYNVGISVVTAVSTDINVTGNTFDQQDSTAIQVTGADWIVTGNKIIGDGVAGSTTGIVFDAPTNGGDQLISTNQIKDCLVGISGTFSGSERTFVRGNHYINCGTEQSYTSDNANSSSGNVQSGTTLGGTATLVAGTVTVNNTEVAAGEKIDLWVDTPGGTQGALFRTTITAGTSFVIVSTSNTDTSTVGWRFDR